MATTKVIKDLTEFNPGNPDYILNATNAVTVINSGGNQYNFNGVYGKFGLRIGTTVLTGVPSGHPIAVLNDGLTGITYTGTVNEGTLAVGGVTYTFYSGDVTITVTADFGVASYYCKIHGYMGGLNNLVSVYSTAGLKMPKGSSSYAAPPTVAEGMMRNEVGQISEGSVSCMQHYNGTDWKNFVNTVAGTTCDVNYPVANAGLFQLNGNITDETGNLTASDANITYVTGNFGQAAQWNNTGTSYINTGFSAGSSDFSISFWFNDPNPSSWSYLFGTTSGGAVEGYSLNVSGGDLDIIIRNTSGGSDIARVQGGVVSANTWHNIVFTFDSAGSGTNTIYLDGNAFTPTLGSNPFTGKPPSNSSTLYLGQAGSYVLPGDQFDGKMDQVRIFTTTLTQGQVTDLQTETPC